MANGFLEGVTGFVSGAQEGGRQASNDFLKGLQVKDQQENREFLRNLNQFKAQTQASEKFNKQLNSITSLQGKADFLQKTATAEGESFVKELAQSSLPVAIEKLNKFQSITSSIEKSIGTSDIPGAITALDAADAEFPNNPRLVGLRSTITRQADQEIISATNTLRAIADLRDDSTTNFTPGEMAQLQDLMKKSSLAISQASLVASKQGIALADQFRDELEARQEARGGGLGIESLTGEAKNRAIAAELERRGDPRAQEAIDTQDKVRETRARFQGLGEAGRSSQTVQNIFDEVGPLVDRIFTSESFGERIVDGVENLFSLITQEGKKAVDLAQYDTIVQGVVGQVRRVVGGEKGVMTEQDAKRIIGLFPRIRALAGIAPDNKKVAKRKIDFLQEGLNKEVRTIMKEKGFTDEEIEAKLGEQKLLAPDQGLEAGAEDFSSLTIEQLDAEIAKEQARIGN